MKTMIWLLMVLATIAGVCEGQTTQERITALVAAARENNAAADSLVEIERYNLASHRYGLAMAAYSAIAMGYHGMGGADHELLYKLAMKGSRDQAANQMYAFELHMQQQARERQARDDWADRARAAEARIRVLEYEAADRREPWQWIAIGVVIASLAWGLSWHFSKTTGNGKGT